jgi:hypothetical protein
MAALIPIVVQVAISAALSAGIAYAARALAPKPKASNTFNPNAGAAAPNPLTAAPQPGGPQLGVFGHRRVAGRIVLSEKSGGLTYLIIAIAGAPINAINAVYVNNQLVSRDTDGYVLDKPWFGSSASSIEIDFYDGTQVAADAKLVAAFTGWTADHIGLSQTYARIIIDPTQATSAYSSNAVPDFTFDVTGFPVYDPRNVYHEIADPSTWTYSDNAALINAAYLVHELGAALPMSRVDWDSVAEAADICDEAVTLANGGTERRYTSALYWSTDERHEDVLARAGAAHAGGVYAVGGQYKMATGASNTSTATITPDDYEGDGLQFSETPSLADIANGVRGSFASPLHNYEPRDFPAYQDAAAVADDGGVEHWLDMDLAAVTSHTQAQRLARIAYNKTRYGYDAQLHINITHLDVVSNDVITLTDDLAGISAGAFRVQSDSLGGDYSIRLALAYEAASFFTWTAATDEKEFEAYASLLGVQGEYLPPGAVMIDQNISSPLDPELALYNSPSDGWTHFRVRNTVSTGEAGPKTFAKGTAETTFNITGNTLNSGFTWYVRVQNADASQVSAEVSISFVSMLDTNGLVEATSPYYALPSAPSPFVLAVFGGAATLSVAKASGLRSEKLRLYSGTTSVFADASLESTVDNADGGALINVSGESGQAKFFWAVVYNETDDVEGSESNAVLVVF